jgi:hypothetical protein
MAWYADSGKAGFFFQQGIFSNQFVYQPQLIKSPF